MRIGVSNIAWTPEEDEAALDLFTFLGVTALEIAPTRYWPSLDGADLEMAAKKAADLRTQKFEITSFQAILFGQPELRLFDESRGRLFSYLRGVADLCAAMGATAMVFGAPKNRLVPAEMNPAQARAQAVDFFQELGAYAAAKHVFFALEANPAAYGGNFCTHVAEVAEIVRAVDSPGLRWHLDTGEFAMNAENVETVLAEHGDLIGSAHISQPNLDGFAQPWEGHVRVAKALRKLDRSFPLSIEMKRQPEGLPAVEQAILAVRKIYGD